MSEKTGYLVLVTIIALTAVLGAYLYVDSQNKISILSLELQNSENERNNLQGQLALLNQEYLQYSETHSYLNEQYEDLLEEYQGYEANHTYTEQEYLTLETTYHSYVDLHKHSNLEYDELSENYTSLTEDYNDLVLEYDELSENYTSLTEDYNNLVLEHEDLYSQYDILKEPKLVHSLDFEDETAYDGTLRVFGEVWNVGSEPAYKCKVGILATFASDYEIEDYLDLGIIEGESGKGVNVEYDPPSGETLTNLEITLDWYT